jgi:inhibitor of KinA sporulation pathway (predicted exonuclease)
VDFIIFDLEATCWNGNNLGKSQEIIEIGAVRISSLGEYRGQFQQFVKPKLNPNLSAYCQELTGIEQPQINRASSFEKVTDDFKHWIDHELNDYVLCSWGAKDIELLQHDCALFEMETKWLSPHIDLKAQFHRIKKLKRKQGLYKTIDREGFEFEGNHHRALDDSINTAKLFVKYLDEWRY